MVPTTRPVWVGRSAAATGAHGWASGRNRPGGTLLDHGQTAAWSGMCGIDHPSARTLRSPCPDIALPVGLPFPAVCAPAARYAAADLPRSIALSASAIAPDAAAVWSQLRGRFRTYRGVRLSQWPACCFARRRGSTNPAPPHSLPAGHWAGAAIHEVGSETTSAEGDEVDRILLHHMWQIPSCETEYRIPIEP